MALLALDVPEHHRIGGVDEAFVLLEAHLGDPLRDTPVAAARLADTREIALDVGEEHGHADAAELLGEPLQGHRLARTRCTRDQAVPVGHAREDRDRLGPFTDEDGLGHVRHSVYGECDDATNGGRTGAGVQHRSVGASIIPGRASLRPRELVSPRRVTVYRRSHHPCCRRYTPMSLTQPESRPITAALVGALVLAGCLPTTGPSLSASEAFERTKRRDDRNPRGRRLDSESCPWSLVHAAERPTRTAACRELPAAPIGASQSGSASESMSISQRSSI